MPRQRKGVPRLERARGVLGRAGRPLAAASILGCAAACSFVLNHDDTQCHTDDDCAVFGAHPYCRGGVCVSSGLGPASCVYVPADAAPARPEDFLNRCSDSTCVPFDDCARVDVCGDASPSLVDPPDAQVVAAAGGTFDAGLLPSCVDPASGRDRANVVYMSGASTWPPILARLAPIVYDAGGPTLVFKTTSSCAAVDSIFHGTPITDPPPGSALSKYATYFLPDGGQVPCVLGAGGVTVDVGGSDIYSTSCGAPPTGGGTPTRDSTGPIQAVTFIVPSNSAYNAISSSAARAVFGAGGNDGGTVPWTDPSLYLVRNAGTGSQQMVSRAIDVPADRFWGVDEGTATNLVQQMALHNGTDSANEAIGFVSVNSYDANRSNVAALAFKASGQDCAYLPDSTAQSTDKRNVRDGHYPIWGPIHFLSSTALPQAGLAFLNQVAVPKVDRDVLDAYIASSLVPTCAMDVQRDTELGPVRAYDPPYHCGCYFESKQGTTPPECIPCTDSSACPPDRSQCNLGFCEVR